MTFDRKAWRAAQRQRLQQIGIGPHPKDTWGCIVTVREVATGESRARHFPGYRTVALLDAVAWCDSLAGSWVIQSHSTPETILSDLTRSAASSVFPERQLLSKIGRRDLIAPRTAA